MGEILTTKNYWNQYCTCDRKLPITENLKNLAFYELNLLFKKYLLADLKFKFIELGCAPGGWMHYFKKHFHYQISGLDYTDAAIEISERNLKLLDLEARFIKSDILDMNLEEKFNVVFSAGFIEHFTGNYLDEVIKKHFQFVDDDGYLVILVPNLRGFNYFYESILDRKTLALHNTEIMSLDFFKNLGDEHNMKLIFSGYVGRINLGLFTGNVWILRIGYFIQLILDWIYRKIGIFFGDSKYFSPYIVSIYKK